MTDKKIIIGVLGLQGDIEENVNSLNLVLKKLNIDGIVDIIQYHSQINKIDGLLLPGGESTVMSSLITMQKDMKELLKQRISDGMPVMGTCAGMIMLAKSAYDRTVGETKQQLLGNLDVVIERNAFGRQNDSFETDLKVPYVGNELFKGVFIRAPIVASVGNNVEEICKLDGKIVAVKQNNIIGTSFHPELANDDRFHSKFVNLIIENKKK